MFRYDTAEEEACFQRQGVADYALMVRVLQRLKVHGCLLHRQLSFRSPRARTTFLIIARKRGVRDDLRREVADTRAHIETISIDSLLHGDPGDMLQGYKDELMENFASVRDTAMTRRFSGTVSKHRSKYRRQDANRAMSPGAQRLNRVRLHTAVECRVLSDRTRVQQLTADVPLTSGFDGFAELQFLTPEVFQHGWSTG